MTPEETLFLKKIIVENNGFVGKIAITSIDCETCREHPTIFNDTEWHALKAEYRTFQDDNLEDKHYAIYLGVFDKNYMAYCDLNTHNLFDREFILGTYRNIEHEVKLGENYVS